MAEPLAPDDLLSAAVDALPGNPTPIGTMLADVRQRVRERARDGLRHELGAIAAGAQTSPSSRPRPVRAQSIPLPERDRPISIRLRNGRRIRAVLTPAVARRSDVASVARASAANHRRAFDIIQQQSAAIEGLKRSHEELLQKIAGLQKQADDAFLALTQNVARSRRQLRQVAARGRTMLAQTGTAAKAAAGQLQQVRALAVTQQAQNLTNVFSTAQATAYGERGSVLATNNLLLAGNQLLWTFLAPLSQLFGASVDTSITLASLAPLGSLFTGYAAVGSRVPEHEQERFVTGITTLDKTFESFESLRDRIADDLWDTFRRREDVLVTATPLGLKEPRFVTAEVLKGGVLHIVVLRTLSGAISVPAPLLPVRVAWMVDTGADGG